MAFGSFRAPPGRSIPTQVDPAYVDERQTGDIVQWMPTRRRREVELPEREPSNFGVAMAIVAVLVIGLSLIGSIQP